MGIKRNTHTNKNGKEGRTPQCRVAEDSGEDDADGDVTEAVAEDDDAVIQDKRRQILFKNINGPPDRSRFD